MYIKDENGNAFEVIDTNARERIKKIEDEGAPIDPSMIQEQVEDWLDENAGTLFTANVLTGKKLCAIGDSMVAGHTLSANQVWCHKIANRNGMTLQNLGANGRTLTAGDGGYNPLISMYTDIANDADIIVVWAGYNDTTQIASGAMQLGTLSDSVNSTFYGAMNLLCDGLYTNYPDAKKMFITPFTDRYGLSQQYVTNPELAVRTAMLEVCEKFHIPVYDTRTESGVYIGNSTFRDAYMLDTWTHLNEAGHQYISTSIEAKMRML